MVRSAQLDNRGVAVRCDGSDTIGLGHVVRMMALARALQQSGITVRFLIRAGQPRALDMLRAGGHDVCLIEDDSSADDDLSEPDAEALCRFSHGSPVIVDHYCASGRYFGRLKDLGVRYGVIDDLADRDLTGADWVLNPVAHFQQAYTTFGIRGLFVGPQYALLRQEFARMRAPRRFLNPAKRLLLTLGGGMGVSLQLRALQAALSSLDGLEVVCAVGGRSALEMAELMAAADVAVSAAGQTGLELACMGVPAVLVRMADNQRENAAALERCGCAIDTGVWDDSASPAAVLERVQTLLGDAATRARMSRAGMDLVDGTGAERAAKAIGLSWELA